MGKFAAGVVVLGLTVERRSELVFAGIDIDVASGYYLFTPSSQDGIPVSVSVPPRLSFEVKHPPSFPDSMDGRLYGHSKVPLVLEGRGEDIELTVEYQACDGHRCLMPVTTTLTTKAPLGAD